MTGLVIIDDEQEQVEGIRSLINWNNYGIEILGTAANGREGLELIKRSHPEIAIIDIRMPLMSGLALIEELHAERIKLQVIILSGYDDFYYAQKAIELNTGTYLLKPCKPEEILQAVLKAQNTLEEEAQKNSIFEKYENLYKEHLPLLKEKFLTELIEGKVHDQQIINQKKRTYGLRLTGELFTVIIFSFDQYQSLQTEHSSEELEYLQIGVQDLVTKTLGETYSYEVCRYENNPTIILSLNPQKVPGHQEPAGQDLLNPDSVKRSTMNEGSAFNSTKDDPGISVTFGSGQLEKLCEFLKRIKARINQEYGLSVTIGIGTPASLSTIWRSYQQASMAVDSRFFYGENRVVVFEPNLSGESTGYLYPLQEEQAIISALESGNTEGLTMAVEDFFQFIHKDSRLSKDYIHKTCLTLLSNIMRFCLDTSLRIEGITTGVFKIFDQIMGTETIDQLQTALMTFLQQILKDIKGNNRMKGFVQYTVDYIHRHYQENINLKAIADQIHISPSYLSLLFKQETGINFIDYLNRCRLEKAKELLNDPKYRICEIAYQVGYNDEKYFYQVFKRYTGLTASQFRESNRI